MARVRWLDDGEVDMASGVRGLLALAVGERRSVGRTSLKVNWQRFRRFFLFCVCMCFSKKKKTKMPKLPQRKKESPPLRVFLSSF